MSRSNKRRRNASKKSAIYKPRIPKATGPPKNFLEDDYFKKWVPVWQHNKMENYETIKKDFEIDERNWQPKNNICLTALPKQKDIPVIILGSGVSLEKFLPLLKDWKHPVLCPTSSALTFVKYGRDPDFICGYDSHHILFEHLYGYEWKNSTLLVHPYIFPPLLKWWKWKKIYFRRLYEGLKFSETMLPMEYPWIKVGIKVTGCVVNNAITIADFLQFRPMFLFGVDFGWKDNDHTRIVDYRMKDGKMIEYIPPLSSTWPKEAWKEIIEIGDFKTKSSFLSFKTALLKIWTSNENIQIIDCSDGLVTEMSKADGKEVIKRQGKGFENLFLTRQQKIEKIRKRQ